MLVSRQKYKENIAEYILYMWQIEDLARAFHLNIDDLYYNVIEPAGYDEKTAKQIKSWYEGIFEKMRIQSIEEAGHLHELRELVSQLQEIHVFLLTHNDNTYRRLVTEAQEYLREFSHKSKTTSVNEIEIALSALYMKLLLRLQQKPISEESEKAFKSFSRMVSYATQHFHAERNEQNAFRLN